MSTKQTAKAKRPRPELDVSCPSSVLRAGRTVTVLLIAFLLGMVYLAIVLVVESPSYMAKSGRASFGLVYDRKGDVLFDGTQSLKNYPAGQFSDVGNLIGDMSGQMTNTLVNHHMDELVNYSFTAHDGKNVSLHTTLDHQVNRAVFNAFGGKNGAAIACNWKTGEVLACVSKPCVDIAQGYANIANMPSGSLLCKAFYPLVPGSTQKVSTLIAAYEKLGVDAVNATEYDCSGSWLNTQGQRINCHNNLGHGHQNLSQAFSNSCNPYFAQLVQSEALPLSAIIETYTAMGYSVNGEKASALSLDGISIPAASTNLTDANDFTTQWGCLGQGDTLVSPFQLMLWQTAIANGSGAPMKPYLLASRTDYSGKTKIIGTSQMMNHMFSATAAKAVQQVMMNNASSQYSGYFNEFQCGVKSGTAQVKQDGKEYENSLLVGFCLDDDCPVAFCIVIEERYQYDISTPQIAATLLHSIAGR